MDSDDIFDDLARKRNDRRDVAAQEGDVADEHAVTEEPEQAPEDRAIAEPVADEVATDVQPSLSLPDGVVIR